MHKRSVLAHLLSPSLFQVTLVVAISLAIVLASTVNIVHELYGPQPVILGDPSIEQPPFDMWRATSIVANDPILAYASTFILWAGIGATVYIVFSSFYRALVSGVTTLKIMRGLSVQQGVLKVIELIVQLVCRFAGLLALYGVYHLIRFCIGLAAYEVSRLIFSLNTVDILLYIIGVTVGVTVIVWAASVGLRLMLLRSRVFGDDQMYA